MSDKSQSVEIKYNKTIKLIKEQCNNINMVFSKLGDGRLTSAIKEKEYLDKLSNILKFCDSNINIERPPLRHWYDIKINGIPINLKITTGGTDNAFSKTAISYCITGKECKKNLNFNEWYDTFNNGNIKRIRDKTTEYHYLVIMKNTGDILLKSLLDIHSYKSNPSNILQINWNNEFLNSKYITDDCNYRRKILVLLETIQKSVKQSIETSNIFAYANLECNK